MRSIAFVLLLSVGGSLAAQPKMTGYPFAQPPLAIHETVVAAKVGEVPAYAPDEEKLLRAVWEERATAKTPTPAGDPRLIEAVLFACEVTDPAERKRRIEQIEKIVTAAKEATARATTAPERGELLMKHLHATVMKGGYETKQSSLTVLLDGGKYNCVSSSVLYHLVGSRLGMNLQPIAIPGGLFLAGHVALDLIDGTNRIQVEPTGPDGFDYAAKIEKPGVVIWGPQPDRKKAIDIDSFGLAASIYSNRGVEHAKAEPAQFGLALRDYLAALTLEPRSTSAASNLVGVFVNWGPALQKDGKSEEAVRLLALGRKIAPEVRDIRSNHETIWTRYIDATLHAGKDVEAIELTKRALKDFPEGSEFSNPAQSFERYGWTVFEEKGPEAALAVAERGLKLIQQPQAEELVTWRGGIYRRWSQQLLDKKDVAGSLDVMVKAHKSDPKSKNIHEGIAYHFQSALVEADGKGGAKAAAEEYTRTAKAFPGLVDVDEVAEVFVRRGLRELNQEKKYAEALKRIADYGAMLAKPEHKSDAAAAVYDAWGRMIADEKKYEAALEKYAEGLKQIPNHKMLMNNAAVVVDRWADGPFREKMYDEAIRIYQIGLKVLPDNSGLLYNLKICEEKKKRK